MFGPDAPASLTFPELKQLVEGVAAIHTMVATSVDKNAMAKDLETLRRTFQKSVVAKRNLARGTVLKSDDLVLKKAGPGLLPSRLEQLTGKRLARDVAADAPLQEADLET
jgi:sialic acid synthase SpsE